MTADVKLMTAEELLALPDDGMRHELVEGELRTMAPAGFRHGKIGQLIARRLGNYVEEHKLGIVCLSDTGFMIARNPDTVLAPDVPFVRQERDLDERGFYPGPPDLAVEVISPSDTYTEVEEKVVKYLACGTPLVIVVDPRKRSASMHTASNTVRLSIDDALDGGDVVPGWKLPLRDIFD
jgi:Uma2 family endonuclease